MSTTTVTGTIHGVNNTALANKWITFRLLQLGTDAASSVTVARSTSSVQTDTNGDFSVDIWDNGESGKKSILEITVEGSRPEYVIIPSGAASIELWDLIENYQADGSTSEQVPVVSELFLRKSINLGDVPNKLLASQNLDLEIGVDVQAHSAILDATTASFTTTKETAISTNTADIDSNNTEIGVLTGAVVQNETDIATNVSGIATNVTNIATNATNIATNVTNIATNAANITSNDGDITTLQGRVTTAEGDITTVEGDITTLAGRVTTAEGNITSNIADIATNVTDIATNNSNIVINSSDIATNVADIANNVTNIATNVTNIGVNATAISAETTRATTAEGVNATAIGVNTTAIALNTAKDGITAGQAQAIVDNSAKVTNATHTGDVTGDTVLTIADDAVDIPMLSATGTPDATTFLRGDNTWAAPVTVFSGPYTTDFQSTVMQTRDLSGVLTNTSGYQGNPNLTSLYIGSKITEIGIDCAQNSVNLLDVTIPNSVTIIGDSSFAGCTGLLNIVIPDSVLVIQSYALSNCTSLASAIIGASVTQILDEAFQGSTALGSISCLNPVAPALTVTPGSGVFFGVLATTIDVPVGATGYGVTYGGLTVNYVL